MTLLRINNRILKKNGTVLAGPTLPPYTAMLRFTNGVTPTFSKGTGIQVSSNPNLWNLTYEDQDWSNLLNGQGDLIEVIAANTTGVTNMNSMFSYCGSLTTVSLFDTSNVTTMNSMFLFCHSLVSVPLFDTSNVTVMRSMFETCERLQSVPLFNTSNVTDMGAMFYDCLDLTSVPLFDTSSVTNMSTMFYYCPSLTSIPLFDTSNVVYFDYAFYVCLMVESGALALYQQASTQANPPTNHTKTFTSCGRDTVTGAAELAQIPSDWR